MQFGVSAYSQNLSVFGTLAHSYREDTVGADVSMMTRLGSQDMCTSTTSTALRPACGLPGLLATEYIVLLPGSKRVMRETD